MPRSSKSVPVRYAQKPESFNLANAVGVSIIGLLISLLGTGIVSMILLYTHVATLTEAETRTEQQLARHLDHSVDRDAYEKRDASIQRQLNERVTKDEFNDLKISVKEELIDLKDALHSMQEVAVRRR